MSRFLSDAQAILETAKSAPEGASDTLTILIGATGQIHIVDGIDTSLDCLQAQHSASTAFRVTRAAGRVRVEGRSGADHCILDKIQPTTKMAKPVMFPGLFLDRPLYSLAEGLALQ